MKIIGLMMLSIFAIAGCLGKKVVITKEYVINPDWDKQDNSIKITRAKVKKDSSINPFSQLKPLEILNKIEEDSSFMFRGNVKFDGQDYAGRKVYFNKSNGFPWLVGNSFDTVETIGNLQKDTWYIFSNLTISQIYVYVDSVDNVHTFKVMTKNY